MVLLSLLSLSPSVVLLLSALIVPLPFWWAVKMDVCMY